MRIAIAILSAAFILAAPLAAQPRLGARTASPEAMIADLPVDDPEAELRAQIEAANAHPLGTPENPVRVGGPEGERAYLARLRCSNGHPPAVGARSGAGIGAFGSIVAAYEVDCGAAAPGRARIVMDMYQEEHPEERPPPGFTIAGR
ncbi:hypothetical protein [Allosphingosinicella sp.]|jgi:hypothetical protein|uniref:hypothetical protein n=1 Tax=Allosphingosinicella sp. TaxID=2823234 RepID=UPI002EEB9498